MTPPIQTGRAVLPHPAFRSVALTIDWLRLQTKGIEFVLSAARAIAPLTAFTAVHSRVRKQPKAFTAPARSAFWALCRFGLFVRSLTQLYLPTSLGSTIITRFFATTDALTPAGSLLAAHRGSLIHVTQISRHSVSNHPRLSLGRFPLPPRRWPILFGLRHSLASSPESQAESSSLSRRLRRRRYGLPVPFLLLSTRGYGPDAVSFRYWPSVSARSGLSPLYPSALSGARARPVPGRRAGLPRGPHCATKAA
jgi:hypothetical protein